MPTITVRLFGTKKKITLPADMFEGRNPDAYQLAYIAAVGQPRPFFSAHEMADEYLALGLVRQTSAGWMMTAKGLKVLASVK